MTDIATGWTECVAMRMHEQMLIVEALDEVASELPFALLGVDSEGPGDVVRIIAPLHQLLPALVQAEVQDARGRPP